MRFSFTVPDDIGQAIEFEAQARGMSRGEYVRAATLSYMSRYPSKGVLHHIVALRCTDPKALGSGGESQGVTDAGRE